MTSPTSSVVADLSKKAKKNTINTEDPGPLVRILSQDCCDTEQTPIIKNISRKNGILKLETKVNIRRSIPGNSFVKEQASVPNETKAPREIMPN